MQSLEYYRIMDTYSNVCYVDKKTTNLYQLYRGDGYALPISINVTGYTTGIINVSGSASFGILSCSRMVQSNDSYSELHTNIYNMIGYCVVDNTFKYTNHIDDNYKGTYNTGHVFDVYKPLCDSNIASNEAITCGVVLDYYESMLNTYRGKSLIRNVSAVGGGVNQFECDETDVEGVIIVFGTGSLSVECNGSYSNTATSYSMWSTFNDHDGGWRLKTGSYSACEDTCAMLTFTPKPGVNKINITGTGASASKQILVMVR